MFNLDPVRQYVLSNAPLVQALAQVRFPILAKLTTMEGISGLQDTLTAEFPYMERAVETTVTVGESGIEGQPEQITSWHFTDDEGRLLVVSMNSVTFSVGDQYVGIGDFRARFERILHALKKTYAVLRRCDRIGVRFLDVIPDTKEEEGNWKDLFHKDIVGWGASEIVRGTTALRASVSQIQLVTRPVDELSEFPADVQAVIRHGIAPGGSILPGFPSTTLHESSFFLDMDVFVVAQQVFDVPTIITQFSAIHSQIDRFFRWTLTAKGEDYFGLQERA